MQKIVKLILSTTMISLSAANLAVASEDSNAVSKPIVMGYYPNYSGYANNNYESSSLIHAGHAIPYSAQPIPGISSKNAYPAFNDKFPEPDSAIDQSAANNNPELKAQLEYLTHFMYSFLGINSSGSVKFNDSWADLSTSDTEFCNTNRVICGIPDGAETKDYLHYGNFDVFNQLAKPSNKVISIGGWNGAHFIDDLSTTQQIQTFANSIATLRRQFNNVNGIDLDIENDENFMGLNSFIQYFNAKVPEIVASINSANPGVPVFITLQADPKLLNGVGGTIKKLVTNKQIQFVNLMSYDFHGGFDNGGSIKKTGFNNNLFNLNNAANKNPYGNADFSIDLAVNTIIKYVPITQVNIGLAAYARAAFTNIPAGANKTGLYQSFSSNTKLVPGDLDTTFCSSDMSSLNPCSGTFSYRYVLQMLAENGGSLTATDWRVSKNKKNYYIGSTAYGDFWSPFADSMSINGVTAVPYMKNYPLNNKNVYLSYTSAKDAGSFGQYAAGRGLAGVILWTVNGDMDSRSDKSLVKNFVAGYTNQPIPANLPQAVLSANQSSVSLSLSKPVTVTITNTGSKVNGGFYYATINGVKVAPSPQCAKLGKGQSCNVTLTWDDSTVIGDDRVKNRMIWLYGVNSNLVPLSITTKGPSKDYKLNFVTQVSTSYSVQILQNNVLLWDDQGYFIDNSVCSKSGCTNYTNIDTAKFDQIFDKSNLTVALTNWKGTFSCGPFTFNSDKVITTSLDQNNNYVCTIQ